MSRTRVDELLPDRPTETDILRLWPLLVELAATVEDYLDDPRDGMWALDCTLDAVINAGHETAEAGK